MFKIPDRVADLFGDHGVHGEFHRALIVTGQVQGNEEKYLEAVQRSRNGHLSATGPLRQSFLA